MVNVVGCQTSFAKYESSFLLLVSISWTKNYMSHFKLAIPFLFTQYSGNWPESMPAINAPKKRCGAFVCTVAEL